MRAHQPISQVIASAPAPGVITAMMAKTTDSAPERPSSHSFVIARRR